MKSSLPKARELPDNVLSLLSIHERLPEHSD